MMKTRQIPAIIMLIAGFITCIVSIFQNMEVGYFLKLLIIVLIIFYVLGCIIKVIIDKNFVDMSDKADNAGEDTEQASTDEKETEDSSSEKEED